MAKLTLVFSFVVCMSFCVNNSLAFFPFYPDGPIPVPQFLQPIIYPRWLYPKGPPVPPPPAAPVQPTPDDPKTKSPPNYPPPSFSFDIDGCRTTISTVQKCSKSGGGRRLMAVPAAPSVWTPNGICCTAATAYTKGCAAAFPDIFREDFKTLIGTLCI